MVQLQSSWDIAHSSGESHTLVRVRNLQTTLPIGTDAWGRANKPQPVLISASISLSAPFNSASSTDSVTNSTVHYGILSKAILEACKEFETLLAGAGTWEGDGNGNGRKVPMHLRALVHFIHFYLTGQETLPNILRDSVSTAVQVEGDKSEAIPLPVLKGQKMRMLEITVMLPKASLLGSGVSLKGAFSYDWTQDEGPSGYSMALTLHELRIPTLIGVNPNERLAKQMVVASVEMDRYDRMVDAYCELEELVVKTIEASSFQTLEALASKLSTDIIKLFIIPHFSPDLKAECLSGKGKHNYQRIRIALEKPTAVMFADAPVVEIMLDSDPSKNEDVRSIWMQG